MGEDFGLKKICGSYFEFDQKSIGLTKS